jgi:EAL domain-containing protein (putative c-di-GMP-specific phosphodiesterase class I)
MPQLPIDADALRTGIERCEIVVHYHPQIEIRTGAVHGVEALARWQHPTFGPIAPDQFIPLAEEYGLIHQLTLQVMNQAMQQAATWSAQNLDLAVAINLSPLLLDRADLVQEIADLQHCYGLRARQLVFEVTESSLLRQVGVALGVLTRLRLRGFGLSLDDYGTGFSSMQQLARIPFTELKIDRSFVHGVNDREDLQVILRSALEMAAELGLVTVAEGVETKEELRLLTEYGCTFAQGWLFAKPMSSADFTAWLQAYTQAHPLRAS